MQEGRVWSFLDAGIKNVKAFDGLHPKKEISFMTTDAEGVPESWCVISEMPDGSLYLSDVMCASGREKDLMGLLYMSLGKVFMAIEPDGEFYIAAVQDRYRRLAERLFAQVQPMMSVQKIINAGKDI